MPQALLSTPSPRGKRRQVFRQADVTRAAKGAALAGLRIGTISICADGRIEIKCLHGEASPDDAASAFDKWEAGNVH
jgi:hypothetical protein